MKYFLLITSLLLSIVAFAEDINTEDTNLLAKCSTVGNTIRPGYAFFYIIKEGDKLFVIHGLAHKEDNLLVREQTLRANDPLYELKETESLPGSRFKKELYWISDPIDEFPPELKSKSDSLAIHHFESFKRQHLDNQEIKSTIPSIEYFKETHLEFKEQGFQDIIQVFASRIGYTDAVYPACHFWFD